MTEIAGVQNVDKLRKEVSKEWARNKRLERFNGWPRANIIGRWREEGEGILSRSKNADYVPRVQFATPQDREVDRALRRMPAKEREVFLVHYLLQMPVSRKYQEVGLKKAQYYELVNRGMWRIEIVA